MELSIQSLMGCLCGIRKTTESSSLFSFVNYMLGNRELPSTPMMATWLFVLACLVYVFPNIFYSLGRLLERHITNLLLAAFVWFVFWYLWPVLMRAIGMLLVEQLRVPAIAWYGVSLCVVVLAVVAFVVSLNYTLSHYRFTYSIRPSDGYSRRDVAQAESLQLKPSTYTDYDRPASRHRHMDNPHRPAGWQNVLLRVDLYTSADIPYQRGHLRGHMSPLRRHHHHQHRGGRRRRHHDHLFYHHHRRRRHRHRCHHHHHHYITVVLNIFVTFLSDVCDTCCSW